MTICVSVVVPTCRRDDLLVRCLAALAAQDYNPAAYEIIVVDDAASEDTRRLVEAGRWRDVRVWETYIKPYLPLNGSGTNGHTPADGITTTPRNGDPGPHPAGRTRSNGKVHARPHPADLEILHRGALSSLNPAGPDRDGVLGPAVPERPGAGPGVRADPSDIRLETRYSLRTARHVKPPAGGQPQDAEDEATSRPVTSSDPHPAGLPAVRYIAVTGDHGPAVARNQGWRAARGEIVAFTDDDCIAEPGWLRAGVSAFGEGVLGVSGRILMPVANVPTDYELNATGLERSEFVTANCFYRRSALAAAGGFDKRFSVAWREDSDLFFTLLEMAGDGHPPGSAPFRHAPQAVVCHPIRPAAWGVSLRQQPKNQFNALLYKKHPILYRQRLHAATPWHYYAIVSALLAAPIGLLADQAPAAAGALTIWLALTARFCRQRLRHTSRTPAHIAEMAVTSVMIPPLAVFWRLAGAVKYRVWFL